MLHGLEVNYVWSTWVLCVFILIDIKMFYVKKLFKMPFENVISNTEDP